MKVTRKTFDEVMFGCYNPMPMVIDHAHGVKVWDTKGNCYLDFTSGIAVNVLGHTPDAVQKIIKEQAGKLLHCSNIFTNTKTLELGRRLVEATDFDRVFFVNSGTEANECVLKLARRAAYNAYGDDKNEIIAFGNSFHGRTFLSVCVAGQDKYSDGFGPKPGAITHLPFNDAGALKKTMSDKTCAVILEPVQGEGGIIAASEEFIKTVRELCTKFHAMMIYDEIQTGVGRTGYFYAYQKSGIIPDAITTAKGLGSGLPIGAVLAKDEFAKHFTLGTHGSTFGGNPLACAIGCYIVKTVSDEKFLGKVREKGAFLVEELNKLNEKYGIFKEIRGFGLLIGAELKDEYQSSVSALQTACREEGLLTLTAGHGVLRLAPSLNIKESELKKGLGLLDKACGSFLEAQKGA